MKNYGLIDLDELENELKGLRYVMQHPETTPKRRDELREMEVFIVRLQKTISSLPSAQHVFDAGREEIEGMKDAHRELQYDNLNDFINQYKSK